MNSKSVMYHEQVWLGQCQVMHTHQANQKDTPTYWLNAAAWCIDQTGFERSVKSCMAERGLTLLQTETPLPKTEWLAQHKNEPKSKAESASEIQQLIDKVEDNYITALGYLYAIPEAKTATQYLTITEYEIPPLPDQDEVPFWDKEWITPELKELLFGQLDKSEKLRTYFIVDATLRKNITGVFDLSALDIPVQCLFKGEKAEELKGVAPYLIDMTLPDRAWDNKDAVPAFHKSFFDKHWGQNTGIFVRTPALMSDVWNYFRKFTQVPDQSGKGLFFRFWVPTTFYPMGKYLKTSEQYAHVFFPRIVTEILFDHPNNKKLIKYIPSEPRLNHQKLIIEDDLEAYFVSYVRYVHIIGLMDNIDNTLREKEPELLDKIEAMPKSKRFGVAKRLYRLKILDMMQASAIMSIIYRTGINVVKEKAFDYATKNPFLTADAKSRQIILSFAMITNLKGGK